jgi:hypothetical protein
MGTDSIVKVASGVENWGLVEKDAQVVQVLEWVADREKLWSVIVQGDFLKICEESSNKSLASDRS